MNILNFTKFIHCTDRVQLSHIIFSSCVLWNIRKKNVYGMQNICISITSGPNTIDQQHKNILVKIIEKFKSLIEMGIERIEFDFLNCFIY